MAHPRCWLAFSLNFSGELPMNEATSQHLSAMETKQSLVEKRRHPRFFLGLPVRVHFSGEPGPRNIELADLSAGGGYFRSTEVRPAVKQHAAFGFVVGARSVCAAVGHVVRVDGQGFALVVETANSAFRDFVNSVEKSYVQLA